MIIAPAIVPTTERQWQRFFTECIVFPDNAKEYTVATLPDASGTERIAFVTNEAGGYVLAFSDGTNWRRCTDRAVVS